MKSGNDTKLLVPRLVEAQGAEGDKHALKAALLVDDDPLMLEFLRIALDKAGWVTFSAETVADAKNILHAHPEIMVIISDIQMPSETGFDLVNWLHEARRDDRHAEVILATGEVNSDALIAALRYRVFDFLRKPFDMRNLVAAAERAYRTAFARRDRFQRLAAMDLTLEQVRKERMHYQDQLRQTEARFEDTHARLTYVGQTMAGIVSHELRTPLIPIIGLAQVLENADALSAGEIRDFAAEIRRAGESLANIVDNALNFIDIDRQVRTQPHDLIDLAELARDIVTELAPQTGAKRVTVTVACMARLKVRGPRFLLRSALRSLMDNAVKASPDGGTVSMAARIDERVTIDIRDRGPGLCDHVRGNLGAPFMNGDNSDTRIWPGIGLGIASALRIVEACGGSLEVVATGVETGTVMRITLPVPDLHPPGG